MERKKFFDITNKIGFDILHVLETKNCFFAKGGGGKDSAMDLLSFSSLL